MKKHKKARNVLTLGEVIDKEIAENSERIKNNSKDADAYYYRGFAYRMKGDNDQSIFDLNAAIKLNPKHAYIYLARAMTYFYKKDYAKSWKDVNKARALGIKEGAMFIKYLRRASNI
jgi:tetratricopeptide (TPR) repeat protein